MASTSVLSPERRIELNPFDIDAWNLLLRESQVIFYFEIYAFNALLFIILIIK